MEAAVELVRESWVNRPLSKLENQRVLVAGWGTRIAGWWFGTSVLFSHILGMSSSRLTFIFFRGVQTTNQIELNHGDNTYLVPG